jgi:monoamine oxidase
LVNALASHVKRNGGKILTSHPVTHVSQRDGRVSVKTDEGASFPAGFCICTVPSRVITRIEFQPRLLDKQWDAAKQLQSARIMKTQILCKDRFWMKSKNTKFSCFTDTTSDFLFDATLNQPGTAGILCSYSIGDKADDLAGYTHPGLKHKIRSDLQAIFPTARVSVQDINTSPWQRNPMTEGAYAFYRPGQWFTVRELLQKNFVNIYFAGEHIADEQGFMEGAVDTGMIAARRLLRRVD